MDSKKCPAYTEYGFKRIMNRRNAVAPRLSLIETPTFTSHLIVKDYCQGGVSQANQRSVRPASVLTLWTLPGGT